MGNLVYQHVFRPLCFRLAPLAENTIHQESPAVGYTPYVCRHVLAFRSNFFGSITHRGGRDASLYHTSFFYVGDRKVGNRPLGGYVFGERSKTKTVGRNTHRQNQNAQNVGRVNFVDAFSAPFVGLRRRYSPRKPGGRLPTLHLPTRFGVQFKLVRFYYAQRRAGRPRSSPSPLRGKFVGYADGRRFGISTRFPLHFVEGKTSSLTLCECVYDLCV
ncbi:MAG: hypothetical protein LBQ66_06725 [Planctomycetaceae bacterium]|nr:hypothetical protein [Planctomycetaceae bacterium]